MMQMNVTIRYFIYFNIIPINYYNLLDVCTTLLMINHWVPMIDFFQFIVNYFVIFIDMPLKV